MEQIDDLISDWIQEKFSKGEPINIAADALSGIHHFIPLTRKKLPMSWKGIRHMAGNTRSQAVHLQSLLIWCWQCRVTISKTEISLLEPYYYLLSTVS